ncbi:hypothetical protein HanXRQr2_Chr09g0369091 [Helianthus annuus]|uniref:Helitron helicase-like domain-containing protein n=1 Tax=Helianthus annuus TaxID=4232 RepID=A0A251UTK0_HELAN|nr:hypothetical protein HanXRQr2_Chr09g0369091 [Helianthus annuus]KAJ0891577.1 hypothetical protein HanPSC8_Chr09g0355631 [Helianthus annuus]
MSGRKRQRVSSTVLSNTASTSTGPHSSTSYVDNGDCENVCQFCGALFWLDERVASRSYTGGLGYNQCCRGGLVVLSLPRRPFTTLIHLYQQAEFMTNIRAYNAMFSMTSFGANVDEHVNCGSGPYVFKIGGQIHHWIGSLCPPDDERPRFLQMYIYDTDNEVSNRLNCFSNEGNSTLSSMDFDSYNLLGF